MYIYIYMYMCYVLCICYLFSRRWEFAAASDAHSGTPNSSDSEPPRFPKQVVRLRGFLLQCIFLFRFTFLFILQFLLQDSHFYSAHHPELWGKTCLPTIGLQDTWLHDGTMSMTWNTYRNATLSRPSSDVFSPKEHRFGVAVNACVSWMRSPYTHCRSQKIAWMTGSINDEAQYTPSARAPALHIHNLVRTQTMSCQRLRFPLLR